MEVKDKKFKLENISHSRAFIMGIATLLVMFFHTYIDYDEIIKNEGLANFMDFLHYRCNIGVDIFLFLSGVGLYFSCKKNKLSTFYKNRFIRVIPAFLIVTVCYFLYIGESDKIFNALSLSSLIVEGDRFLWYIKLILVLYLMFPLIYKIINKYDFSGLFISVCIVILFSTIYCFVDMRGYENIEIALTRIPVFLIGTYFGKMIDDKKFISKKVIPVCLILFLAIMIFIYFMFNGFRFMFVQRYLYCILAVCLVILISYIDTFIKNKGNWVYKIMCFLGKHSLEIYLLHDLISKILIMDITNLSILIITLISFVVSIILAIILKKMVDLIIFGLSNIILLFRNKA